MNNPYNRPPDAEYPSDIVNPRFIEVYKELTSMETEEDVDHPTFNIVLPKHKSYMWMNNDDSMVWVFSKKRPNWWFRLWQFLLLGWRWKNI